MVAVPMYLLSGQQLQEAVYSAIGLSNLGFANLVQRSFLAIRQTEAYRRLRAGDGKILCAPPF